MQRLEQELREAVGALYENGMDNSTVADLLRQAAAAIEGAGVEVAELRERNAELEGFREHCDLLTHKVITCGVAADHPDPNLTRTGAYASKWNSPQAERVRGLRDRAERLAEALRRMAGLALEVVPALEATGLNVSLAADVAKAAAEAKAELAASKPPAIDAEHLGETT